MASEQKKGRLTGGDLGPSLALVGVLAMMVLPVPAFLLDLMLVLNIALALTILVVALYVNEPLDFSSFPSLLLFTTLARLALNVSSTRLILLHGEDGPSAAGHVIEAFGQFVVGGNYAVGIIVFLILIVINFVVITKGSTRIAEVAARFTLDAMPGKQMAIDADLNAGMINEAEARRRRHNVQKEGDFYGAMDGASKFVRGDAVAALIILGVNLLGGFFIGILQKGLDIAAAARIFSLLSVGDGLVSQIPALIISTAAGMVVTRTASGVDIGEELGSQLLWRPQALVVVAGILTLFALIPGFPAFPFLLAAGGLGWISSTDGWSRAAEQEVKSEATGDELAKGENREDGGKPTPLDLLELEVGYELIPLVDSEKSGLMDRIKALRRQFLSERGYPIAQIHIRDNLRLSSKGYTIVVKGIEAGKGELRPGRLLAMNAMGTGDDTQLEGEPTQEPAFGLPAVWISPVDRDRAEMMGYTVVDSETVLITHLSEVVKRYAPELLTRQDVQRLLDSLAQEHPKVIEELIPHHLTVGGVQKVLQNLLREEVPIRDLLTIVEILADNAPLTKEPDALTEYVRQALCRTITNTYRTPEGALFLMSLAPAAEKTFRDSVQEGLAIDPQIAQRLVTNVQQGVETFTARGLLPVLLTSPNVRRYVRQLLGRYVPQLAVLSYGEIAEGVKIQSLGVIGWNDGNERILGA
ncbi:MAG: flagellar biosynthesis protein FlhA [Deltaproteobacteria bacterium]|nr:flagellar biosynthesis protein FlhA [Deltaproteobacteria bacterium]